MAAAKQYCSSTEVAYPLGVAFPLVAAYTTAVVGIEVAALTTNDHRVTASSTERHKAAALVATALVASTLVATASVAETINS